MAKAQETAKPGTPAASAASPSSSPSPTPSLKAASGAGAPHSAAQAENANNKYLVVIDAAHGGADPGSRFNATTNEKDITLGFARRLRDELQAQNVSALLLRDSDIQMTAEQRAQAANAAHAALYISIHAGLPSGGVRLYTSLLQPSPAPSKDSMFLPWESAQRPMLEASRSLAGKAVEALHQDQIAAFTQPALLPPLNSILVPAIAIELSPEHQNENSDKKGRGPIGAEYQTRVARAIANVISSQAPTPEKTP